MPELCYRCDNRRKDMSCEVCTRKEQEGLIEREECHFASVDGKPADMFLDNYTIKGRNYNKE